jgi:hypothetical protein
VATQATERGVIIATFVVLAAIGVVAAAIESFLIPQRVFDGVEGLSAVLAFAGNAAIGTAAGLATRTRAAAVIPTVSWFVTVGVLTVYLPGGDVVMPGRLPSDPGIVKVVPVFLILGIVAGGVALFITSRYTARVNRPTSQP